MGNFSVLLRLGTSDWGTLVSTSIGLYHRPECPLPAVPVIMDLGSNVGYTLMDFACLYPHGRILGVEMDEKNYDIAVSNTRPFSNVHLINRAVAVTDGEVAYSVDEGEDAYRIVNDSSSGNIKRIKASSIPTLIKEFGLSRIDYLKIDVEGEELRLFAAPPEDLAWLALVGQINLEVHSEKEDYHVIRTVLEKHGFSVRDSALHWSSLVAVRCAAGE